MSKIIRIAPGLRLVFRSPPMLTYDRHVRGIAACLAALAGYCDAIGFQALGGFFVSFMSGNSTRLSVGLTEGSRQAAIAGGLIAAFVSGVVLGSLVGHPSRRDRAATVMALVTALLVAAALFGALKAIPAAMFALALAMGAVNAVFERDGEIRFGVTYMTGTLAKVGQRAAQALRGGPALAWLPYLLLWLALVAGAVAGAAIYPRFGLNALWLAAGVAAAITTLLTGRARRPQSESSHQGRT